MHDFTLGPPVDVGEYQGPLLDGKPLHSGSCEDGVYGCRMCNQAARNLTDEQLDKIGWQKTGSCDWCKKIVPTRDLRGVRPWDEGGAVYYEVCGDCMTKYNKSLEELDRLDREEEEQERQDREWLDEYAELEERWDKENETCDCRIELEGGHVGPNPECPKCHGQGYYPKQEKPEDINDGNIERKCIMPKDENPKIIKVVDAGVIEHKRTFACFFHSGMGEVDCFTFRYYDDELAFSPDELVGLTKEQAFDLFCKRDREYLQS